MPQRFVVLSSLVIFHKQHFVTLDVLNVRSENSEKSTFLCSRADQLNAT